MNRGTSVSIIIVTYNSEEFIRECLRSVESQKTSDYEVIVVDNDSSDQTVAIIQAEFKGVRLIRERENVGFAKANNDGITQSTTRYVVLLNPDTVVQDNWLTWLIDTMESVPTCGACQSKLMRSVEEQIVNSDGNELNFLCFAWVGNDGQKDPGNDDVIEVAYPSGCASIFRRDAFERVGLLDPDLFMYHEDVDVGIRLRLAGYRVLCNRKSVVLHRYSRTRNPAKLALEERNRIMVLLKTYPLKTLCFTMIPLAISELAVIAVSISRRWFRAKVNSYWQILVKMPHTIEKRRKIMKTVRISESEFFHMFTKRMDSLGYASGSASPLASMYVRIWHQFISSVLNSRMKPGVATEEDITALR